ncbi:MAG: serine acetyltransferase [Saprospiraceae bacterium]|nr:serine acetyltransferase [Saprospiraceae bacterium]
MVSDPDFINKLIEKHKITHEVPSSEEIHEWVLQLQKILLPEVTESRLLEREGITEALGQTGIGLKTLLSKTNGCIPEKCDEIVEDFMSALPVIYDVLQSDLEAFYLGDPAAKSTYEIVRAYPGYFAVFIYRIAHQLYTSGVALMPRILSEFAHSKTGIDIHPGAKIGKSFFIDHGTGVVIGETTQVGDHVKIYQGVTLGALSVSKKLAGVKRHPTVGDHTVIYSGATILGGDTVIGNDCIIGGNVWLTTSVPSGTKVYHNAENTFVQKLNKNAHGTSH